MPMLPEQRQDCGSGRRVCPDLPVLFMSGYEVGELLAGAPAPPAKPFRAGEVIDAGRTSLGRRLRALGQWRYCASR